MMSKYVFDAENKVFYPVVLKEVYQEKEMWPDTGVEVTETVYDSFRNPPEGKTVGADKKGKPVWVDTPAPTEEEQIRLNEFKKEAIISEINQYISKKQWQGKAAMGRLTVEDKKAYNQWLDYFDMVNLVDTTKPEWPEAPEQ